MISVEYANIKIFKRKRSAFKQYHKFVFCFSFFLMAIPAVYGHSHARDWIWASAVTYTAGAARPDPLTHCPGLRNEPMPVQRTRPRQSDSSSAVPQQELLVFNRLYFLEQFWVYRKMEWKVQRFPVCPLPPHRHRHRHPQGPPRGVELLIPSTNLPWHVIVTQSPQFPFGFTLGLEPSVSLDKCTMAWIHILVSYRVEDWTFK